MVKLVTSCGNVCNAH